MSSHSAGTRLGSAPVILGGPPSSGTTLLRTILQRHPNIAGGGELNVFDKAAMLRADPGTFRRHISSWLRGGVPVPFGASTHRIFVDLEDYPLGRADLESLAARADSLPGLLESFYRPLLEESGARRWMEKTPGNALCIREIRALYPEARIICLQRDARDCVASLLGRPRHSGFRAASRWLLASAHIAAHRSVPDVLVVRYEDLVTEAEPTVRSICAFLGEDYGDELLVPSEALPSTGRQHASWKHDQRGPVTATSVGRHANGDAVRVNAALAGVMLTRRAHRELWAPGEARVPRDAASVQCDAGYEADGIPRYGDVRSAVSALVELQRHQRWHLRHFHRPAMQPTRPRVR